MAPVRPHWVQPSHPAVQHVVKASETEFLTKSLSKVDLPPFAVFAKMSFPPCCLADEPTYATVQCGRDKHLDLNSDLLYINHSCDPSLIFDTSSFDILAGPKGLRQGDELTFFYPSTEWSMAQPFDCFCGTLACRGTISGARDMPKDQLNGVWLNSHIRELLDERDATVTAAPRTATVVSENGAKADAPPVLVSENPPTAPVPSDELADDATARALMDALRHAEKVVEAARAALYSYTEATKNGTASSRLDARVNGNGNSNGCGAGHISSVDAAGQFIAPASRSGPTSRELAGEMGGDTIARKPVVSV